MAFPQRMMGGGTSAGQAQAILGGGATGLITLGSTYADALALPPVSAVHITTSSASTGGILPAAPAGSEMAVLNSSGQTILIYPPAGAAIDALTATTQGFSMTSAQKATFKCISTTRWVAILSA